MSSKYRRKIVFEGRPYYVGGKTKEEVIARAAIKLHELEQGSRSISKDMTVSSWCDVWLEQCKCGTVNERNYKEIKSIIKKYLTLQIGNRRMKQVKPIHVQAILNEMTQSKSSSYIKKVYHILCQIFREAYINDLIITDIERCLKCPKGKPAKPRRSITDRERELTLKVAMTHYGGLFILIMLYCGLRPGEVSALQWNHVDLENQVLHVQQAVKADSTIGSPKSDAGTRVVPIPETLTERLKTIDHTPFDYICKNLKGGHHTKTSYTNMWKSFLNELNKAAGCRVDENGDVLPPLLINDIVLYDYRHTYGTDLQAAGVPINVARELMGHTDIKTTSAVYTHFSQQAFDAASEKINAYLSKEDALPVALDNEDVAI